MRELLTSPCLLLILGARAKNSIESCLIDLADNKNMLKSKSRSCLQVVYAILQVLALRSIDRKEQVTYESRNMLSQEDRNALDWLSKYLDHKPGAADFER